MLLIKSVLGGVCASSISKAPQVIQTYSQGLTTTIRYECHLCAPHEEPEAQR